MFEALAKGLVAASRAVGRTAAHGKARLAQPSSKVCQRHEDGHTDGGSLLSRRLEKSVDGDDGVPAGRSDNYEKRPFCSRAETCRGLGLTRIDSTNRQQATFSLK